MSANWNRSAAYTESSWKYHTETATHMKNYWAHEKDTLKYQKVSSAHQNGSSAYQNISTVYLPLMWKYLQDSRKFRTFSGRKQPLIPKWQQPRGRPRERHDEEDAVALSSRGPIMRGNAANLLAVPPPSPSRSPMKRPDGTPGIGQCNPALRAGLLSIVPLGRRTSSPERHWAKDGAPAGAHAPTRFAVPFQAG